MRNAFSQSKNHIAQSFKVVSTSQTNIKKPQGPESQLQELITCHICLCLARNLMMCPYCSKIYCQQCIRKSLVIKQQCPHCRKYIRDIKSMANCDRFVNQIKGIVEEVLKQRTSENFKCQQHDVILNYYCVQCQKPVCCECKMFGSHGSHEFVQVEKKYKEKYEDIRQMLAQLKVCIKEKEEFVNKLEHKLKYTQAHHQQQLKQIQKLQKTYTDLCMQKIKKYQQNSKVNTQKLRQNLQNLNETKKQLKNQISKTKNQGKYNLNKEYKQRLQSTVQLVNTETQDIKRHCLSYDSYLSELIPSYQTNTFVIQNFPQKQKQQKLVIYSDPVQISGCQWKLKIHPNGSQSVQGKYFSIYMMMVSKNNKIQKSSSKLMKDPTTYEYFIQIIKPIDEKFNQSNNQQKSELQKQNQKGNFLREYTSSFEPGESWGYNKFIQLSELYSKEFIDLKNNNQITLRFGIRRPDYFTQYQSLCRELQTLDIQMDIRKNSQKTDQS